MSGIVGSKLNHRGSGLVGSLGTDGQYLLSSGAGKTNVFETVASSTYDDEPIKSDLTALALREATNEASAAFNLPGSFIDSFTDDTNLGTQTQVDRTSGSISSVILGSLSHQAITAGETGGGNIGGTATTDMATAITEMQDDDGASFMYTSTNSVSGYIMADLGASYLIGQIDVGKYRGDGDFRSIKLTSGVGSASSTSTTDINLTGATQTIVTNDGNNASANLSNFGSDGTADWVALVGGGDYVVNRITGFTPFSMRWIRFKAGSADFNDNNAHWAALKMYTQAVTDNATGTLIQSTNTVTGTRTSVGGTMLYEDSTGTATLGTDLKIYFTCDNSNWTEAASYTAITPVYGTGIKQVRLGKTTCTGGIYPMYKAVWANQAAASKVTKLHGIGINY